MGFEIRSRNPSTGDGKDYWATISHWSRLLAFIEDADYRHHLGIDMQDWDMNDGDEDVILGGAPPRNGRGLLTQGECDALADAMESLLKEPPGMIWQGRPWKASSEKPSISIRVPSGQALLDRLDDGVCDLAGEAEPFIAFLRRCGGFRIY